MARKFRSKLTYANVMATLAMFVALGGSSYAAITITGKNVPKNALTGADIKNLTGKDVRNNSLTGADVKNLRSADVANGGLLAEDFAPGQLPRGEQGPPGSDAEFNGAAAGGDLTGTYPNPTLSSGTVTPAAFGALPSARAYRNGNFTVPNGTGAFTDVPLDTEVHDVGGLFDIASPSRLTVPIDGVYAITGGARWTVNATGIRSVFIRRNDDGGDGFLTGDTRTAHASEPIRQSVSTVARLSAGDYVEIQVSQTSGGNLDLDSAGTQLSHLSVTWLAP